LAAIEAGRGSVIDFRNAIVDGHLSALSGSFFDIRWGDVTNGTAICDVSNFFGPMVSNGATYNGGTFNTAVDCL
jgi:hypothetical protein